MMTVTKKTRKRLDVNLPKLDIRDYDAANSKEELNRQIKALLHRYFTNNKVATESLVCKEEAR